MCKKLQNFGVPDTLILEWIVICKFVVAETLSVVLCFTLDITRLYVGGRGKLCVRFQQCEQQITLSRELRAYGKEDSKM